MPLPIPIARREIHHRVIDMKAYARDDGLYDVEAHLVDTKPFEFRRISSPTPLPAGEPVHDMWIRLIVDDKYFVRGIEAASDVTPYGLCKEAESTVAVLVGERIASGWSQKVKERLRGAASCTHLMEMLITDGHDGLAGYSRLAERAQRYCGFEQHDSCARQLLFVCQAPRGREGDVAAALPPEGRLTLK